MGGNASDRAKLDGPCRSHAPMGRSAATATRMFSVNGEPAFLNIAPSLRNVSVVSSQALEFATR